MELVWGASTALAAAARNTAIARCVLLLLSPSTSSGARAAVSTGTTWRNRTLILLLNQSDKDKVNFVSLDADFHLWECIF